MMLSSVLISLNCRHVLCSALLCSAMDTPFVWEIRLCAYPVTEKPEENENN